MFNKATFFIFITLFTTNLLFGNGTTSVQPENYVSVINTTVGNHIEWQAANDIDIAFFILQRSNDGIHFETVAMINKSTKKADYTFIDQTNSSTTYYRILNVNSAGEGHYSEIIKAQTLNISAK